MHYGTYIIYGKRGGKPMFFWGNDGMQNGIIWYAITYISAALLAKKLKKMKKKKR